MSFSELPGSAGKYFEEYSERPNPVYRAAPLMKDTSGHIQTISGVQPIISHLEIGPYTPFL